MDEGEGVGGEGKRHGKVEDSPSPGGEGGGSERETTSNFETGVAARLLFQPGATGHKRRLPARCRQTPLPEF